MELYYNYFDEVDSTNTRLKEAVKKGALEGTVYSAGRQTDGRGRSGHVWESPEDESISTSLLLYPDELSAEETALLTPLAALAVCDAIEDLYGMPTQIKWVNDVLVNEKKVSGILTEQLLTEDGRRAVIVGIGINVFQKDFPTEIEAIATSIALEAEKIGALAGERLKTKLKKEERRKEQEELIKGLWKSFIRYYEILMGKRTLGFIRGKYNAKLINRGKRCMVMDPNGTYQCEALGIDGMGRLCIRMDDGEEKAIDSGEVSVRGIYGYV